jgi:hypothetical protein
MSPQKLQKALVEQVLKPYGLHLFMNNNPGGRYKNRNSLTVAPTPQTETVDLA